MTLTASPPCGVKRVFANAGASLLLALLGLGLLPASTVRAQAPAAAAVSAPVPLEAFFGRVNMARPVLSPSGRYLAFLRTEASGRNALMVLDLQDPKQSRALVGYNDADIFGVRWVGKDHLVYSITDGQAGSGEHDFSPGLFSMPRTGGRPKQLVKTRHVFVYDGNTVGADWRLDQNHRLLFVPQDGSDEVIVGNLQWGAGNQTVVNPLRLNVKTLQTRDIEGRLPAGVNHWLFDNQGQPRAAVAHRDGRVRVLWRGPDGTEWRQLLDASRTLLPWEPYGLDAAGSLFVIHPIGPEGVDVLSRFDFAKGRPADQPLVSVPGFDFHGSLVADPASGRTLGVRALTDGEVTVWTDPAMKALQERIDQMLPGRINRLTCRPCDADGGVDNRTVLVESWADRDPGSFYIWQGASQKLMLLGRARPAIEPARMAALQLHHTRARDGRGLPVWLTLPQREAGAPPPPVVVLVHGGPMVRGSTWAWHDMPQFLASRGYAVVEPEFRGSTGYGSAHTMAGWKQWGQAMQDDVADALNWAAAEGHVDSKRACIAGASYGGYATLMGLVRHPGLYRCGIAEMAVTDLVRLVEGSWWWRDDISEEGRRYDLPLMVGDSKADLEMLRQNSPVLQAARIRAPVLLVHGSLDQRVPVVHARDMRKALREAGQEPEWLLFDGEGHGWRKPENQLTRARRVEAFLARHLPPTAAAAAAAPASR